MPRKARRLPAPAAPSPKPWRHIIGYISTAVFFAGLGAGGAYLAVPRPEPLTGQEKVMLGNGYYNEEKWDKAIQHYMAAVKSGHDNPDVRTDLGNAYRFSDRPKEALAQYRIAQQQNPQHETSFYNQAGLYALYLHDVPKGISLWEEYIRRFPKGQHVESAKQLLTAIQAKAGTITGHVEEHKVR